MKVLLIGVLGIENNELTLMYEQLESAPKSKLKLPSTAEGNRSKEVCDDFSLPYVEKCRLAWRGDEKVKKAARMSVKDLLVEITEEGTFHRRGPRHSNDVGINL
jgi:hypothetical protein